VWGSEFVIKIATLQEDSAELAPTLNVKLWDPVVLVVVTGGARRATPFLAQSSFRIYLNLREKFLIYSKEPSLVE
jgi:hypothetical protein